MLCVCLQFCHMTLMNYDPLSFSPLFMWPHVADGHIMHGCWVSIVLHMGTALQGHQQLEKCLWLSVVCSF